MLRKADCTRWAGKAGLAPDPEFEKAFPTLHAFLTQTTWPDDPGRRELGSLAIYPGDGVIRVLLKDPNGGLQAWVAVDRLSSVFVAVEAALLDDRYDWRLDKNARQKQQSEHVPPPNGKALDKRKGRR